MITGHRAEPLAGSPVERLRPRTGPQILDAGFDVLKFRAARTAAILIVLHGPFFAGSMVMARLGGGRSLLTLVVDTDGRAPLGSSEFWWIVGSVAAALFGEMLVAVGLATLIRAWLEGRDPGPREVVVATLRRLPAIFAVWVMAAVIKLVGAALCRAGLILVVPYLSILAPVVAFESGAPGTWISRSRELVGRASNRVLFLTTMAPLLSLLIMWGIQAADAAGLGQFEEFASVMGVVVSLLLLVARCNATALMYLDIRVRTEGLDLEMRAAATFGAAA